MACLDRSIFKLQLLSDKSPEAQKGLRSKALLDIVIDADELLPCSRRISLIPSIARTIDRGLLEMRSVRDHELQDLEQ